MASIAVTTAGVVHVVESLEQMTLPCEAAILAGNTVTISDTAGGWVKGDADGAGTLADIYGIATRSGGIGESITAIRRGVLTGWTWSSTALMTKVLAADTAGEITVTAGESNGGSADVVIGRVIPIHTEVIGGTLTKALLLTL